MTAEIKKMLAGRRIDRMREQAAKNPNLTTAKRMKFNTESNSIFKTRTKHARIAK
jgi:hypothetical protein